MEKKECIMAYKVVTFLFEKKMTKNNKKIVL